MKTDAEVLDGAIAILEQEGHWCQQEFYQTDEAGTVLSYCAEGALLEAAGFWEVATAEKNHFDGLRDGWRTRVGKYQAMRENQAMEIWEQHQTLGDLIVKAAEYKIPKLLCPALNAFNDDEHTTASDVILAMKKARTTLEDS